MWTLCARLMSLARAINPDDPLWFETPARCCVDRRGGCGPLSWLNHGPYLLKGVEEPLEVCEVGEAGKRSAHTADQFGEGATARLR